MANRRFIDFPIAASVGNNDIVLIWQDGLNKQTTKSTLFAGSPSTLASLTDVDISALTNGQILQYNSTTSKWENVDRTDIDLDQLGDVTIVSPTNGQVLVYNSSTSKWENSSGGFVPYTGAVTTVNLGAQSILAGSFVKAGGTSAQFLKANGSVDSTAYGTGSVTSVGLSMPSAFNVASSPVTTNGTIAVTAAGNATQYVRGDGVLATLPTSGEGGGASVSYYLNGSVNQGTIGGVTYYEMNKTPIIGAGTDFTRNSNGYIASFLTDANDPALLVIPAGNWNFETYFEASSGGGSPTFYLELYKYNGTTFTLVASNSGSPKLINDGTSIEAYFSALAVPQTTLTLTDRLAIRIYVTTAGRTITLHTENGHLCQVITTFTTGLSALNGLTSQVQFFAVGTSGTNFNIASASDTHTFNLPTASATNRGALASADWTTFNSKQNQLNGTGFVKANGTTISYDNSTYQITSEKGQPNGYASLDGNGKVPLAQINDALIGNVNYQGLWNAATNNPTLANPPSSGTKGYYYIVSTAGTFAGISFEVGDWIISNGSAWQKVDNTDAVSSVFGRTGNVTATNGDYNTSQVTELTNLYYTEARVNANANVAANTAARHAAVTLGTANGLSLNVQQLSLQLATSGQNGALSSTDWSTFNNKENAITAGTTAQYFRGDKTFQTLNTSVVPELTNLYYTEARVSANTDVAANTAARHAAVTLGTANGLSLSTQQLSLGLASAGVTGALSGTDWSTFNSKQQALNGTGFVKISGTTISYDNSTYLTTAAAASTYLPLAGGTMTGAINIVKDNDVLNITPVTSGGYSVVNFNSRVNLGSDKGFIVVQDESAFCEGSGNEDLRMSIGVFNDFRQSSTHSDELWLQGGGRLVYNVGSWDSELNTIIGTPGVGTTGGYEWRVNNSVVASLNPSGNLTAASIIRSGGTSSQFLKADGSIDSNAYITGNQTITLSGDATGSGTTAITVVLANSGVAAGTYNNSATQVRPFTVDAKGRITSIGTAVTITPAFSDVTGKPTTLAGYGITDAYTQTQVNTLLSGYLPLTGGTLTGALVGTSASFSGNLTVSTGNATGGGIILADDGDIVDLNDAYLSLRFSSGVRVFSANRGGSPVITLANTGAISANGNITGANLSGINTGDQTLSSLGGVPTSRTITINGTTQDLSDNRIYNVGTVTSVAALTLGTTGTDLSSSVANGTTTPVITLNVPTASASNRGALSAADWTTFNNKQNALTNPVTGTGTTNYLPKFTGTSTIGNSQIFDNGSQVGINETSPTEGRLVVNNPSGSTNNGVTGNTLYLKAQTANANLIRFSGAIATDLIIGRFGNADNFSIGTTGGSTIATFTSSGNLGLGVTPSAWGSSAYGGTTRVLELGELGSSIGAGAGAIIIGNNWYSTNSAAIYSRTGFPATYYAQNTSSGQHQWYVAPSGTAGNAISFTQAMTLGSNSGLSIGTPSAAPAQGLLVQGAATFSSSVTAGGDVNLESNESYINLFSSYAVGLNARARIRAVGAGGGSGYGGDFRVSTRATNNVWNTDAFVVDYNGNVGIGTASPQMRLHIVNTSNTLLQLNGNNTTAALDTGFTISADDSKNIYLYQRENAAAIFATNNTERMRITAAGRVLIGTPPPAESTFQLDVNGTGRFSGNSGIPAIQLTTSGSIFTVMGIQGTQTGDVNWLLMSGYPNAGNFTIRQSDTVDALVIQKTTGAATFTSSVTANGQIIQGGGTARSTFGTTVAFTRNVAYSLNSDATDNNRFLSVVNQSSIENAYSTLSFRVNPDGGGNNAMLDMKFVNLLNGSNLSNQVWSFLHNGSFVDRMNLSSNGRLTVNGNILTGVLKTTDDTELATDLGNVKIGTTSNAAADKLRVNGNTFTNTLMTWNPQNDNRSGVEWRFGAASIASITPNRRLRVNVGGIEYYIAAVEV